MTDAACLGRCLVPLVKLIRESVVESKMFSWKGLLQTVLAALSGTAVLYVLRWWVRRQLKDPEHLTWWLFWLSRKSRHDIRCKVAYDLSVHKQRTDMISHTHPEAAKHRNEVLRSLEDFVASAGRVPYHVSMSRRERGDGKHVWYWAKDVDTDPQCNVISQNHVIVGMDVDYYLDLKQWAKYGVPMMFYTLAPKRLAGSVKDATYYVAEEGDLVMQCRGGGSYRHQLWAYDADTVVFDYWWGSRVFSLELRDVGNERQLVIFIPTTTLYTPLGWLIPGMRMRRREFRRGNFALQHCVDMYCGQTERFISISRLGSTVCAYIPEAVYYTAKVSYGASNKASAASIMGLLNTYLQKPDYSDANIATIARVLLDHFCEGSFDHLETRYDATVGQIHRGFIVTASDRRAPQWTDEDAKLRAREVSAPLVTQPAVVPADTKVNDVGAIVGRLEKVKNDKVPSSAKMLLWSSEFDEFVLGDLVGKLQPWSYDEVYAVKTGGRQRARLDQIWDWITGRPFKETVIKAFIKTEPYVKINDPRNISTLPVEHNLELARYEYCFKEQILKKMRWYAPGQTLERIAQDLADAAQTTGSILEADANRMDGTVGPWEAEADKRLVAKAFAHPHNDEYIRLVEEEDGARGRTRTGVIYQTGSDTKSGSDRTTNRNTRITARRDYCALRKSGMGKMQAWQSLLKYGGDDLASNCTDIRAFEWVANQVGADYDYVMRKPGDVVTFLSRHFPYLWTGGLGSVQDPYRLFSKIHITCAGMNVPIAEVMINKARGLRDLDPAVELSIAYADALLRVAHLDFGVSEQDVVDRDDDQSYWQRYSKEVGGGNWPQLTVDEAREYVCKTLGVDARSYDELIASLDNCFTRADLMALPQLIHRVVENKTSGYIVGDQFDGPKRVEVPATYEAVVAKWEAKAKPPEHQPRVRRQQSKLRQQQRRTRVP